MRDPLEGVTSSGTIRTGASLGAIARRWLPVLDDAQAAVADQGSLYLYGSVATGAAVSPHSDVDLLSIGLSVEEAGRISTDLSARYDELCRGVSIEPASLSGLQAEDERYGLRVFLRHYCVHLCDDNPAADLPEYAADARAARGFNGDIAAHRSMWLADLDRGDAPGPLGTRIARKSLLAVAGLVSVRDGTWTTARFAAATRWEEPEPSSSVGMLSDWLREPPADVGEVRRALVGPVAAIEMMFAREIGLWSL